MQLKEWLIYTNLHWADTSQKEVEKLATNNPTKDGSLKLVFSEFYFFTSGEGLERKTLTIQVRGVGAAPTFRSNSSEGVIYLDYYTVEGGVGNHFPNYKLKKIIFIQNENFSSTYE